MLRKTLVATLTLLYSATAIGMPLHFHYCRGELKHITVLVKMECHVPNPVKSDHTCCKSIKPHCEATYALNNCCDDATQWIQDDIPALCLKNSEFEDISFAQAVDNTLPGLSDLSETNQSAELFKEPSYHKSPLYLLQCSLIYYG